jgi:hypothetical protein
MKNLISSVGSLLIVAILLGLLTATHWTPPDNDQISAAETNQLHDRELRARKRGSFKLEALQELIDGRWTLAESAEQLAELMEPQCRPQLQSTFPADTVEQSLALQIISNVRSMPMEPTQANEVLSRLDREFLEMKRGGLAAPASGRMAMAP